jgi:hypothetical protein
MTPKEYLAKIGKKNKTYLANIILEQQKRIRIQQEIINNQNNKIDRMKYGVIE